MCRVWEDNLESHHDGFDNGYWTARKRVGLTGGQWQVTPKGVFSNIPMTSSYFHQHRQEIPSEDPRARGCRLSRRSDRIAVIAESSMSRQSSEFAETSHVSPRHTRAQTTATHEEGFRRWGALESGWMWTGKGDLEIEATIRRRVKKPTINHVKTTYVCCLRTA